MPIPFIMPKMDMDQQTVVINEWLKKEGDMVEKGEPVVIIETDKITSEVEAPASGRLAGVLYADNEEVPVTQVIAYILEKDETEAVIPDLPHKKQETFDQHPPQETLDIEPEKKHKPATPVAKRMADAEKVDLSKVPSTGEKITKEDVLSYIESLDKVAPRVQVPATPAARRIAQEQKVSLSEIIGTGPSGRVQAADVGTFIIESSEKTQPSVSLVETLPLSRIRKRIADKMTESYQNAPHIYLTVEVDMHEAEESRKRINQLANEIPVSLTSYLIRVVAWALKRHPFLNAGFEDGHIKLWDQVNIGIATAIDEGLIVPVIHNADQKTIREISKDLAYLTTQAKAGVLTMEEVRDGTFTISNLGMFGIQSFTAIINPPQTAILAVGSIKRKPIVIDKEDTIKVRPMMMMTLGADHRVVDGAVAANFLTDLVKALETPELLLM